jgi:hypothetical protein
VGDPSHNLFIATSCCAVRLRGDASGGTGIIAIRLRPDARRFASPDERLMRCRHCGTRLVVLPDDRRQGFCFDCFDLLDANGSDR